MPARIARLPSVEISPGTVDFGQVGVGVTSEVGLPVPIISVTNVENDVAHVIRGIQVVDLEGCRNHVPWRLVTPST